MNYVTLPGVALTPYACSCWRSFTIAVQLTHPHSVCFPQDRYEDATVIKCFSNLLAVNFRRFVVDLYWDVSRSIWSLCPAELGDLAYNNNFRSIATTEYAGGVILPRQDGSPSDSLTFASTLDQSSSSSLNSISTTTTLNTGRS